MATLKMLRTLRDRSVVKFNTKFTLPPNFRHFTSSTDSSYY